MVKLTNLSTVAILLVAIIASAMKAGVTSAGPSAKEILCPSAKDILSDSYYETCKTKVGEACGITIVSEMFFQNATTDASCCRKMLTMGKNCHANMLGKILNVSPFKENKALALQRSRAILGRCSSLKK